MNGLGPLLKKELKEQIRTHRLLIVGGIFLFFGLTTPLMLKYLPQIIQLAGTQEYQITIPPPTPEQSLVEYAGTIGQLGVLMAVLIAMGSISNELKLGTAVMTLSKPVSKAAYVNAKLIAVSLTFTVSTAVASAVCYVYTVLLIGGADALAFAGLNLLVIVFLVFCLAVTIFFSTLFKSSLAAGVLAFAVLIGQAVLSTAPVVGDYIPGKLLGWGNGLLSGGGDYWWALGVTVASIVSFMYFAQRILKGKEL